MESTEILKITLFFIFHLFIYFFYYHYHFSISSDSCHKKILLESVIIHSSTNTLTDKPSNYESKHIGLLKRAHRGQGAKPRKRQWVINDKNEHETLIASLKNCIL